MQLGLKLKPWPWVASAISTFFPLLVARMVAKGLVPTAFFHTSKTNRDNSPVGVDSKGESIVTIKESLKNENVIFAVIIP